MQKANKTKLKKTPAKQEAYHDMQNVCKKVWKQ